MKFIIIFLGIVVGVILFLGIIAGIIWYNVKKTTKKMGLGNIKLSNITSEMDRLKSEDSNRVRSVSGMTKLLLPTIIKDFPEFNENQLYNITEDSIRTIFKAISNKDKKILSKIPLMQNSIANLIDDYKENNIDIEYSDITFYDFAIKDYSKEDGVATVSVSTSLSYYYKKSKDGKIEINDRYKKQTRFACKFIYIYDESLVKDYEKVIVTNCPNCGAVIKSLGHKYCDYCGSQIKEINLKAWAFSSYEEY